jgi:hypothetical protein
MRASRILLTCLMVISAAAEGQVVSADVEAEIKQIDRLAADPDTKLQIIQSMALELGTHRNHLIFLKKQGQDSFGQVYVKELRKRGLDDEAVLKKLRSVIRPTIIRPLTGLDATGFRPIAYVGTTADNNSAGTFVTISPEVGIDSRRFAFVVGIPIYRISATQREATGVGDAYASVFVRQPTGSFDVGAALTIAAPTGNRNEGLGAGRVSVDLNGTVQRRFERVRPFVTVGFTNSLFNNVGYQRPFISNGNSLYASGGIDYRVHRRFTVGLGGFGVHAMGDQMVISQMTATALAATTMPGMRPGHVPPGMGTGSMGSGTMPIYGHGPQTIVPGSDVSDRGVVGWTSWSLSPSVTLSINVARSIPYELTTVRVGLGFDLSRPLARLLHK